MMPDPLSQQKTNLRIDDTRSYGINRGEGNLVGIQPFMLPGDYANPDRYFRKLKGYLGEAEKLGWLLPNTLVAFPEYIGTWLVAVNEPDPLYRAATIEGAMKALALKNPRRFVTKLMQAKGTDRVRDALFRMKSGEMARIYQETFSRLAREYDATIIAGSIILPEPEISGGELKPGSGSLRNISIVFQPGGEPYPEIVTKVHTIAMEGGFIAGKRPDTLPVFDAPSGRLGVLICADSWYPDMYEALARKDPRIIVAVNNELPAWEAPWGGYDPGPPPEDVDPKDEGTLLSKEAWLKYALPTRLAATSAEAGMQVFFHGQMWDLISTGQTIIVTRDRLYTAPLVKRGALVNYWL